MHIQPKRVALYMGAAILIFLALSLIAQALVFAGAPVPARLVRLVDLDDELNLPTAYQSLTLGCAAVLMLHIASLRRKSGDRDASHWAGLAAIFCFLALDEALQFHERLRQPMKFLREYSSFFRYGWAVVGAAFALVVGLLYLRFLRRLPRSTASRFVLAGGLYVLGAVGMEMVAGRLHASIGTHDFRWMLLANLEETMEMLGVLIFLVASLRYAQSLPVPPAQEREAAVEQELETDEQFLAHP